MMLDFIDLCTNAMPSTTLYAVICPYCWNMRFGANAEGQPIVDAYNWLKSNLTLKKPGNDAPLEFAGKS
jgi:hypothetical protein